MPGGSAWRCRRCRVGKRKSGRRKRGAAKRQRRDFYLTPEARDVAEAFAAEGGNLEDFDMSVWDSSGIAATSGGAGYASTLCDHFGDEVAQITHGDGRVTALLGASSWGFKRLADAEIAKLSLIIDCAGVATFPPAPTAFVKASSTAKAFLALNRHVVKPSFTPPPVVELAWADGGVPFVGAEFWVELCDQLPGGDVLICCVGGHGRTGTALGALLIAGGMSFHDAMKVVWGGYCKKAVETKGQIGYLQALDRALHGEAANGAEPKGVTHEVKTWSYGA